MQVAFTRDQREGVFECKDSMLVRAVSSFIVGHRLHSEQLALSFHIETEASERLGDGLFEANFGIENKGKHQIFHSNRAIRFKKVNV